MLFFSGFTGQKNLKILGVKSQNKKDLSKMNTLYLISYVYNMSMDQKPSWFGNTDINIQPPAFIPEHPAPDWVRTSVGNRNIIPSASLFANAQNEDEIVETKENTNKSTGSQQNEQINDLIAGLNVLSLDESRESNKNEESLEQEPLIVDVKVLSTLCHVTWKASAKSRPI